MGGDDGACVPPSACQRSQLRCAEPMPPTFTTLIGRDARMAARAEGAGGAKATSCWRTASCAWCWTRPRTRRAWRRPAVRSSTSRRWQTGQAGDQINADLPGGRPAAARRRPLREGRDRSIRLARRTGCLRRGRVPRPPGSEPARHRRHPLRAAPLRARRPRPHRPLQRRRASRTRSTSPTGSSGATTALVPFVPGAGLGFLRAGARPARLGERLARVAVRRRADPGAARRLVRRRAVRSAAAARVQQPDADRGRRAAGDDAAAATASTSSASSSREPGPGLAPAVGEALRVRAMVHGEPAPVTVTGRVVAGGTADRRRARAGGVAAVLRAGVRPRSRRPGAPQAVERGGPRTATGASRWRCRPTAATGSSRTPSGCRPRPPTSFAVAQAPTWTSATSRIDRRPRS